MNARRISSYGFLIVLNLVSALLLHGCAGLSHQGDSRLSQPPLGAMPVSSLWTWNRVDAAGPSDSPHPTGANGIFVAPGLLLTVRHFYPLGRMKIDGVRTFVTGLVAIGGPFGGTENDWVLIRTKVDSQPPYPALHSGPVPVGSRGFIVGHELVSPDLQASPPEVFDFEVIGPSGSTGYLERTISVRVTPADAIHEGFSGSPAYLINKETGRPELMGIVVGGHTDVRFLGITVGKGVVTIAPIPEKVDEIVQSASGN